MMKKISLILLLVGILPLNACAQWYLFPGKKKTPSESSAETPIKNNTELTDTLSLNNENTVERDSFLEGFFSIKPSVINITLALPLEAKNETYSSNFLEMYSGALIALSELSKEGMKYKLNVIDTKDYDASYSSIESSHIILGPVSYNEILRTLPLCSGNQLIISPLDPKTAALAQTSAVLQSPVPQSYQIEDMINWLDEDFQVGEQVLVCRDLSESGNIISLLNQKAIPYTFVKDFTDYPFKADSVYRIVIASDSDAFLTGATRNIAIEAERNPKSNIILYCNSRIRSSISQNVGDLHKVRARMTAGYHIDYESAAVKEFILKYRALYNSEPGSFAFQGYDAMKYYVGACLNYGINWSRHLSEYPQRGLQSDFKFSPEINEGKVNIAVRRIVYNKNFSTTLL